MPILLHVRRVNSDLKAMEVVSLTTFLPTLLTNFLPFLLHVVEENSKLLRKKLITTDGFVFANFANDFSVVVTTSC